MTGAAGPTDPTLRALPPPFRLVALDCIDSTNDEARRAVGRGEGHGTVIWAAEQSAGRGRRGRNWVSPRGNLHCSLLLDAGPDIALAPQLVFVAAVAVRDALAELAPAAAFQLKWPNDLLCGGRKIAGMLLEMAAPLVILGIGVDVALAPEQALYPATCLARAGSNAEPFDVLAGICRQVECWYDRWRNDGFDMVRQVWLAHAAGLGQPLKVALPDDSVHQGRFIGLDAGGALVLEEGDGHQTRILAGDVLAL